MREERRPSERPSGRRNRGGEDPRRAARSGAAKGQRARGRRATLVARATRSAPTRAADPDAADAAPSDQGVSPPKTAPGRIASRSTGSAPNSVPMARMFAPSETIARRATGPGRERAITSAGASAREEAAPRARADQREASGHAAKRRPRTRARRRRHRTRSRLGDRVAHGRTPGEPFELGEREEKQREPERFATSPQRNIQPHAIGPRSSASHRDRPSGRADARQRGSHRHDAATSTLQARSVGTSRLSASGGERKELVRLRSDDVSRARAGRSVGSCKVTEDRDEPLVHRQVPHRRVANDDDRQPRAADPATHGQRPPLDAIQARTIDLSSVAYRQWNR